MIRFHYYKDLAQQGLTLLHLIIKFKRALLLVATLRTIPLAGSIVFYFLLKMATEPTLTLLLTHMVIDHVLFTLTMKL